MTKRRTFLCALGLPLALVGLATAGANWRVERAADRRVFLDADQVPSRRVGLVLGTSPRVHGGKNPFFERRLDAAAALYRAHKVRCLLVSGDHGTRYYDEPLAMREGLVARGVPGGRIVEDCAGFRTLDSLVRAHKVFRVDRAVIVTDGFHLPRALYLAQRNGIDAVGLSSVPVSTTLAPWPATREIAARVLVVLDVLIGRQPRFLGPSEKLPG